MTNEDIVSINSLKILAMDIIRNAGEGHAGVALGAAPIIYDLYSRHLLINPNDPNWINRSRMIVSCGHASSLVYAMLHFAGYPLTIEDLKNYRRINSRTPGLLEYGTTPGVEVTAGALGSGVAFAVGVALSRRYLNALTKIENSKKDLIDYQTFLLVSDGDLMEGISDEALSFAGSQKLNNLIVLYDSNDVSLDGNFNNTFNHDILKKYDALGFDCYYIKDAYNLKEMDKVLNAAKKSEKPVFIQIKTVIGKDSIHEGKSIIHSMSLDDNDYHNLKIKLNVKTNPFEVSKDAILHVRNQITNRITNIYNEWQNYKMDFINSGNSSIIEVIKAMETGSSEIVFNANNYQINDTYIEEMLKSNNQIMEIIANKSPLFLTGSADVFNSCKNMINKGGFNTIDNPLGKNIEFGVREMAMAGIMNGIASTGITISGSTFLAFSDYMKSQIRLSALMNLPVTYIFTHDSIKVGSNGATHQPVEQLVSLRSIPNFYVYRPCDVEEIMGSWESILTLKKPSALILSKEVVKKTPNSSSSISNGAYIIRQEKGSLDAIIISTGDNVFDAVNIANTLENRGKNIRVVSMPCQELFLTSDLNYQREILPNNVKRIVIEPSNPMSWDYFTERKNIISVSEFGYSGSKEEVLNQFNYTYDNLLIRVAEILK